MSSHPTRRAAEVLVVLTAVVGLLTAVSVVDRTAEAAPDGGRTWVVDAVDDLYGARWVAADTGSSEVTIEAGDTVEWQFDQAVVDHDLTSQDSGSAWVPAVAEYRRPGGAPVRRTFTTPGTYDFLCSIHGTVMHGTVVVLAPDPGNTAPTGTATAQPGAGPAPLEVRFAATASDPDGDPLGYHWAFGTGAEADGAQASYTYDTPGTYTATVEVSDGRGGTTVHRVPITVTSGRVPDVTAVATPAAGGPLTVAYATEVSTTGTFTPYADGTATYPRLAGTAGLVRARGRTTAYLDATGLAPGGAHLVHVHEQACASAHGGAHFRFDETRAFGAENEIWLPFTADAAGRSGRIEVAPPLRAGAKAVSIVIHDPDNPARRIGCVDLVPDTADLSYAWDFGDGTTATGSDPDHAYAAAGSYLATVTVSRAGRPQAAASSTVRVVVGATTEAVPQTGIAGGPAGVVRARRATFRLTGGETFSCRVDGAGWRACTTPLRLAGLRDGRHRLEARAAAAGRTDPTPAVRRWSVDTTAPTVRLVDGRAPVLRFAVRDRLSGVRRADVVLRVDGRVVRATSAGGPHSLTLRRALGPGPHAVVVAATDAVGNRRAVRWRLR
ncbi:PKD domain-containing protein [Nocardioides sp. MAH-18]|uniref:PKD domain-containing protein n=1 Tax=Nocardioides agri TaxID=2682843 RepID=A0A6L6XTS1_9ACTN|nr:MULTISPECIES: PKD domain-containing protein [unclassified Nocardioides]MBA2955012.1 PKD domain-containing protein [Nocardioides sp. CGMCC 1.13656]MVQ49866.1 PKD domain-containing protein [Nocardioides sp. MAH-18]